jgi:hypothetical protein
MIEVNWNPSPRDLRQFAGLWLPAFALAFGIALLRNGASWRAAETVWALAAAIAIVGALRPSVIRPMFVAAMALAYPIGFVTSHIVLGIAYFGVFTATGLIMRLVRYDPLQRQPEPAAETYWTQRPHQRAAADYFKQF